MTTKDMQCGCPEFTASRRNFLRGMAAVAGAGAITSVNGTAFTQASFAASPATTGVAPSILVMLSLRGGADGLSLVVPHGDPAYDLARRTIALPTSALIASDEMFGLHPGFAPILPMWAAGTLAAVHAVGLPAPNRSHFAAMEAVEDADPGSAERRGWLNRLVGLDTTDSSVEAIQVGSHLIPTALYGPEPVLAIKKIDDMYLPGRDEPAARARRVSSLNKVWKNVDGPLGSGARAAVELSNTFENIAGTLDEPHNGAVYPAGDLGAALAETARLIRAEMGAEVITIDYGSWDMHAGLGTLAWGPMQKNVTELALCIAAFFQDVGTYGTSVTVVTISEFGRRVEENASKGLDHGYGNVMLLAGAGVNGGRYYGEWPGLAAGNLVDGDLAVTRDYRSVLTEVVRSRFNADASRVFPGFSPEPIGVMSAA